MTREELRVLWDRAEATEALWQAMGLADTSRRSADERFAARLELDAAYNAMYEARLAFNEASRQFGKQVAA